MYFLSYNRVNLTSFQMCDIIIHSTGYEVNNTKVWHCKQPTKVHKSACSETIVSDKQGKPY